MSNSLSVSVQTRVNAPLEKVWQVLTDFGSYHTWHPILTLESHAGPLAVGTLLQGQSSDGPAGEQPVAFTIALVQEPNHLAWTGGDPEVVAGRHSFQLEQLADGTTELIESEVFTGPAAPEVIGGQLPELHAAYETFAAAFKKRVEEALQRLKFRGLAAATPLIRLPVSSSGRPFRRLSRGKPLLPASTWHRPGPARSRGRPERD